MDDVVAALAKEPGIENVQPNYLLYKQADTYYYDYTPFPVVPNDIYYKTPNKEQWYINQIRADKVYNEIIQYITPTADVIVAVIDTGVDIGTAGGHEDLHGVTVTGANILNPAALPYDDDTDGGHGTHVSGVIAANTNNIAGIAGVCGKPAGTSRVRIMPVKALDSTGTGSDADIYTAIVWAADNGAFIINLSLGGPSEDEILKTAVNYADGKGCLVIAAAGNSNSQTFYPAAFSNVMSVAATDMKLDACGNTYDVKASFSNWGKVDIAAPGVNIFSTSNTGNSGYSIMDGTSFSCPMVSAAAALVKLVNPAYTNTIIRNLLQQTADDDYHACLGVATGINGYDKYFGWGRLNISRALALNLSNTATQTIVTYNWPNPFSPDSDIYTNITFTINKKSDVTVFIYDGGGELVWKKRVPAADVSDTTQNFVKWDGKTNKGKLAANGTYFYIVKNNEGVYGKNKIAVLF
jgi:thermitase